MVADDLDASELSSDEPALEARDLTVAFGGLRALDGVSLTVRRGDVHALIGPNGAGKTSLLNCASGLYRPQAGAIWLHGADGSRRELTRLRPSAIARLGVARSFQNVELFRHMSVLDNLLLGRHVHMRHRVASALLFAGATRRQEARERERAEQVARLLDLLDVRARTVGTLPYGTQKRVELGRALCMEPSLLLLDEPMAGLSAEEKRDMTRRVLDLRARGAVTTVLVEHDMDVVMEISDRITVLDFGRVIADGSPRDVARDRAVVDAYLGAPAPRAESG